jgi:hypothetical protein
VNTPKSSRLRGAGIGLGLSLALAVAPAFATVTDVPDADDDAFVVTDAGVSVGDYDIDLRNVRIDHGTKYLRLTSTFSYTVAESWTDFTAWFDTDHDGVADYEALWSQGDDVAGVVRVDGNAEPVAVTCASIDHSQTLGANGAVVLNLPRTCLGNAASVAVHVDVFWFGTNTSGDGLSFVDSAPGLLIDEPMTFSGPVASSNTGTATSPLPPRSRTKVVASLSKAKVVRGKRPPTLRVTVAGAGGPSGTARVADGAKVLRTLRIAPNRTVSLRLPKTLKVGTHRIKVTFTPTDEARFTTSSRTLKLVVRR